MRADARRNYDLLVDAARKVFADEGGDASMEAIAKQAGVGVGTLYRHFPKRIDLVEAVWHDDVETLVGSAEAVAGLEPWDALEAWLRAFVDYARSKRVFLNELHEAFEKQPDLRSANRDRIKEACQHVLTRAQKAGAARADVDAEDLMALVSPMCISPTFTVEHSQRVLPLILDGLRTQKV